MIRRLGISLVCFLLLACTSSGGDPIPSVRQITHGPAHHFFGYIGHVRTIPWNASGRYILALRAAFQDRMPGGDDAAEIVLLDSEHDYAERVVNRTRAWNFQQGTMFYWNPEAPETQFFFNDRDPKTQQIFCVLFDLSRGEQGERIAEYRYADTPVGNSGVAQTGGAFAAINYGRLARLRPVTGYPTAYDWTVDERHPSDDGVFRIDVATREKRLLVSFEQLAAALRPTRPDVDEKALFINHTLWSRGDERIFFFVRGDFDDGKRRLDVPFTMRADGTDLRMIATHFGGHPEWLTDRRLIGSHDDRQIIYDLDEQKIVGTLGNEELIPEPGGDVALSPDGTRFVNGYSRGGENLYTILNLVDDTATRASGIVRGKYRAGELRIDPSPCWNRAGTQLLVGGLAEDGTRQMFLIDLR
ncbi:MAG: hypothetical protein KF708_18425 [Pirellulales bacterium]|nr:hypothetical protein [Pirellulales bacterium]